MSASAKTIFPNSPNRGQALLLVLFAMAVILTVGLASLSRSVSDISISEKEEEASRAFSAAEAGVEQTLLSGSDLSGVSIGDAKVSTLTTSAAAGQSSFAYPEVGLMAGQTATLWFVSHDANSNPAPCNPPNSPCYSGNQLKVCWGDSTGIPADQIPAIEVTLIHTDANITPSSAQIKRWTFDPNTLGRTGTNKFSGASVGATNCHTSRNYSYSADINLGVPAGKQPVLGQITFFYNTDKPHPLAFDVTGFGTLPSQGQLIKSQGTAGTATQTIQVFRSFATLPSLFTTVLGTAPGSGIIQKQQ